MSHLNAASPATAAPPAVRKLRRVFAFMRARTSRFPSVILRSSASRAAAASSGSGGGSGARSGVLFSSLIAFHQLVSGNHRAEIIPSRADHLRNVDHEKSDVPDGEKKMLHARSFVSAEQACEPGELGRLVDGKSADHRERAHHDHARVGKLLRAIKFFVRQRTFVDAQVVQHHENRFAKRLAARNEVSPLARHDRVQHVDHTVDREEPSEEEVPRQAVGQMLCQAERVVESRGKEGKELVRSPTDEVNVVAPINPEAAPEHQGEERKIDPVAPANRQRVLGTHFQAFHSHLIVTQWGSYEAALAAFSPPASTSAIAFFSGLIGSFDERTLPSSSAQKYASSTCWNFGVPGATPKFPVPSAAASGASCDGGAGNSSLCPEFFSAGTSSAGTAATRPAVLPRACTFSTAWPPLCPTIPAPVSWCAAPATSKSPDRCASWPCASANRCDLAPAVCPARSRRTDLGSAPECPRPRCCARASAPRSSR